MLLEEIIAVYCENRIQDMDRILGCSVLSQMTLECFKALKITNMGWKFIQFAYRAP
jgi:hypothetical protein